MMSRTRNSLWLVAVCVSGGAAAQLLMKTGMLTLTDAQGNIAALVSILQTPELMMGAVLALSGLGIYGVVAIIWLRVLQFVDLSVAYPAISLSYVLVYAGAVTLPFIDEPFSVLRVFGIILIMLGVTLISTGHKGSEDG